MTVGRNKTIFEQPPVAVPAGNVDVSGGGRWKIWQDAGTKIDAPILGNGDMLAALAGNARFPQFWITTNDFWQMESAASWEFFHDNASAKCDPEWELEAQDRWGVSCLIFLNWIRQNGTQSRIFSQQQLLLCLQKVMGKNVF